MNQGLEDSHAGTEFYIQSPPSFSLPAVVRSHGWVQMAPFEILKDADLAYVIQMDDGKVIRFSVRETPDGLLVEASDHLETPAQAELAGKINWMLGLDQDFSQFYALAAGEPKLAKMVARQAGRVLRSPSLFEDVIRTLLTTNTLWRHTLKMCRDMVRLFGNAQPGKPEWQAFPTPNRLAQVDEPELREQVRMGYRAPYIASLAQAVASGALDLEEYKTSNLPTSELRKELMRIKGVGGYAAANLLMILGRYDYVPVDSWALKVVSAEFFGGESITPKQVLSTFERWGEWQGLAYWFWDWKFE